MQLREYTRFSPRVRGLRLGLELEIEGRRLPPAGTVGWSGKADGSLRNGREYVTDGSIEPENAEAALENLRQAFRENSTVISNSIRCSTHVHVNVQELTLLQIATVMTAYYVVEPLLAEYCGVERSGNLFALRLVDTAAPLRHFMEAAKTQNIGLLGTDSIRYCALNITSLPRFGTLEYRMMRGIDNSPLEVLPWVNMLVHLHRFCAAEFENPAQVLEAFSGWGAPEFTRRVLGRDDLYKDHLENEMYESARVVQWFAYQLRVELSKNNNVKTPTRATLPADLHDNFRFFRGNHDAFIVEDN